MSRFINTVAELPITQFFKKNIIIKKQLNQQLDFARTVGKRLDEHRETVEAIIASGVFKDQPWHINHLATQDDYLMRLYFIRHGHWPVVGSDLFDGECVRARPIELGPCQLPEWR